MIMWVRFCHALRLTLLTFTPLLRGCAALRALCCFITVAALCTQMSYSSEGLFIHVMAHCETSADHTMVSALYAFPKMALYSKPPSTNATSANITVPRATYLTTSAWYRSLPPRDQTLTYDPSAATYTNAFNTYVLPSRPQGLEDIHDPVFVIGKVSQTHTNYEPGIFIYLVMFLSIFSVLFNRSSQPASQPASTSSRKAGSCPPLHTMCRVKPCFMADGGFYDSLLPCGCCSHVCRVFRWMVTAT